MARKKGELGIGLDALFDDNTADVQLKKTLRVSEIEPNRSQPRKTFTDEAITALAESIKEHGIIQPLLVRPLPNGMYQIVAGERRWRASRMLGLDEVPVFIRELSDAETMQIALIENLQRENLNPIEEAQGYKDLMDNFSMTQDEVAKTVGRSRSAIANSLRLLNLPEEIKLMLKNGDITTGHAKALGSIEDEKTMLELAKKASEGNITVRGIEKATAKANEPPTKTSQPPNFFKEMELSLKEHLGRRVKIRGDGDKGALILEFYDTDDLSEIAKKLTD